MLGLLLFGLLGIGFFGAGSASAQIVDRAGVKVGWLSTSATDNPNQFEFERRSGWSALLFAERDVLPFFALVLEAGYTQRGFVETFEERAGDGTVLQVAEATTRLDYLTIPVLGKASYGLGDTRLYALAGPRLDVLVGREPGVFQVDSLPPDLRESQIAGAYTSPVLGATVGAGVSAGRVLPVELMVEARWALDVTESFAGAPRDVRNNAVSVMIGIAFWS